MQSIQIELHLPQMIRHVDIFAVGTFAPYVDAEAQAIRAQSWLDEVWQPLGQGLQRLVKRWRKQKRVYLAISDAVLDLLESPMGAAYLKAWQPLLKEMNWQGSMPTPGYNYSFLDAPEALSPQLKPQIGRWEQLLGQRPTGFYLPFGLYANPLAYAAFRAGFTTVWVQNAAAHSDWFVAQHLPDLKLGVYGPDPHQGQIAWYPYHQINTAGGVATCLAHLEGQWQQDGVGHDAVPRPRHVYEWAYFEQNAVYPFREVLQQNYRVELQKIKQSAALLADPEGLRRLHVLSQAHLLQELATNGAPMSADCRNFPTAQDAYLILMNIIADLELRVKSYG